MVPNMLGILLRNSKLEFLTDICWKIHQIESENSMSDHYFGDMVGHFGAFSKYGALMIAGKNDDRGATEFYDN